MNNWRRSIALKFVHWLAPFCFTLGAQAFESNAVLHAWFRAQTNVHTWSADVVQTRALKSLAQPLTARGRVWFAAPNRFRWELGEPPQTLAVRQAEQMLVIYPRLNRAERYALDAKATGPWRDALMLMEAGFSRSLAERESRFQIVSLRETNQLFELTLQPKTAAARRLIPQIKIACGTNDFSLKVSELKFTDGSILRNEFTNAQINPQLDEALFSPPLGPDVKIVEPLGQPGP